MPGSGDEGGMCGVGCEGCDGRCVMGVECL